MAEECPLGYVEYLNDARTTRADFFSILLDKVAQRMTPEHISEDQRPASQCQAQQFMGY